VTVNSRHTQAPGVPAPLKPLESIALYPQRSSSRAGLHSTLPRAALLMQR